jgi:hypothetical protein
MERVMLKLRSKVLTFVVRQEGQDLLEYALVIGIVFTGAVVALGGFGSALIQSLTQSTNALP